MGRMIDGELHSIWCIEDVMKVAEEIGVHCSDALALKVLEKCGENEDATIGINWDVIRIHLVCMLNDNSN